MCIVIFSDGSKLDCLSVRGEHRQVRGAVRDCLIFGFDLNGDVSLDKILSKFKDEKVLKEITLQNQNSEEKDVHFDYTIFDKMEIKDEVVSEETNNAPAVAQKFLYVTVGQVSYSEKLMQEQKEQLDNMSEVFADMLGGAL